MMKWVFIGLFVGTGNAMWLGLAFMFWMLED